MCEKEQPDVLVCTCFSTLSPSIFIFLHLTVHCNFGAPSADYNYAETF